MYVWMDVHCTCTYSCSCMQFMYAQNDAKKQDRKKEFNELINSSINEKRKNE